MAVGIIPTSSPPIDDDLYREIILDHYRHPRRKRDVSDATHHVEATNPLCGDEVTLAWRVDGDAIGDIGFAGRGCSICMASASLLCETLAGNSTTEAVETAERFRSMLLEAGPADGLGDLEALQGVAAYPVRIKCAILAWNAFVQEFSGTTTP